MTNFYSYNFIRSIQFTYVCALKLQSYKALTAAATF